MKIACISTYLPQECGIATYTNHLISGIKEVAPSLDIKVIAEKEASPIKEDKFEVIPCWSRDEDYVESIVLHTKDVDIIHIQHEYNIYGRDNRLPKLLKKLDKSIKKVVTIHCIRAVTFSEMGAVDEGYAVRIARFADEVIVHLGSQKVILTRLGISPEKIHVIPHGTKLNNEDKRASRERLDLPTEAKILLMLGFIKPFKHYHIIIEVFSRVLEEIKDVYLFIAGGLSPVAKQEEIEYAKFVESKIAELNLNKNIIYPKKFFPDEEVPYLLAASDIVLLPYHTEDRSASGILHLAIGAKKPVIAFRIPKFEELKNICDELLIIPSGSSSVITRTIIFILKNEEFNRYIVKRTEEYREKTSWAVVARSHLKLYEKSSG